MFITHFKQLREDLLFITKSLLFFDASLSQQNFLFLNFVECNVELIYHSLQTLDLTHLLLTIKPITSTLSLFLSEELEHFPFSILTLCLESI